jgi:DNA invertase Pin-like site-specific DNA recombinase
MLFSKHPIGVRFENMRVGYARVSTTDQEPALQTDALKRADCQRIFEETASGARADRPQLKAALQFIRGGDTLVVWKLDRLARSLRQLIDTIADLERRGIAFVSLTEKIDTTTAGGRFLFHIMGALAEFEREIIRERTVAGLAAARARGRTGGRPRVMMEKQIDQARALAADPNVRPDYIAERVRVSVATIYRYLPALKTMAKHRANRAGKMRTAR